VGEAAHDRRGGGRRLGLARRVFAALPLRPDVEQRLHWAARTIGTTKSAVVAVGADFSSWRAEACDDQSRRLRRCGLRKSSSGRCRVLLAAVAFDKTTAGGVGSSVRERKGAFS
jgi:hypothetical protein